MKYFLYNATSIILIFLAGCQSFGFADRYDSKRESEINSYHKKVVAFVSSAEKESHTEEGRYSSASSIKFYSEQRAALANLVINAEASDQGRTCSMGIVQMLTPSVQTDAAQVPAGTTTGPSRGGEGRSCTVIVLRHLQSAHDTLEEIHKENGYLEPPTSVIALAQVEDAVRIALRNENAKR